MALCTVRHLECLAMHERADPVIRQICDAVRETWMKVGGRSGTAASLNDDERDADAPRAPRTPSLRSAAHLRLQVVLQPDLTDQAQLDLEEIDVIFFAFEDILEQLA